MAIVTKTVEHGQSMVDMALQYYGSLDGMLDISRLNNLSFTDVLQPGTKLIVTETINEVTKYLGSYNEKPTHLIAGTDNTEIFSGIGYWIIENDFIVQ